MSIGWDAMMKMLVHANPQDLVSLVAQDTRFLHDITEELIARTVKADFLCKAIMNDEEVVVHVEFQRNMHPQMDRRMWEYNCVTAYLTNLPVCSYVIYLWEEANIVQPPYQLVLANGKLIHVFYYENICLWKVPPEVLKQKGLEGLLPLLPLTKGADTARDEIIDDMIKGLQAAGKENVLALGYAIAGHVYQSADDQEWLKRRFEMFHSVLEDSWSYREMVEKEHQQGLDQGLKQGLDQGLKQGLDQGLKQGLEQGIDQGLEQGLKAIRPVLLRIVEMRFPELTSLAQQQAERITVPEQLSTLIEKLLVTQTSESARQVLTNIEAPPTTQL